VYAQNTDFVAGKDAFDKAEFQAAIASFEKVCQAEPKNAGAQFWLGRSYLQLEDYDNAIDHLESAIDMNDSDASFHTYYAMALGRRVSESSILKKLFAIPKVKHEMERAVELTPNDPDYREALGELYAELPGIFGGGKEKALAQVAILSQLDPYRASLLMANIYQRDRKLDSAETELRKAITLSPVPIAAHLRLAGHYKMFLKDYKRAIQQYREAVEIAPENAECHDDLGIAFFEASLYDDAIREYDLALLKNPKYADAVFHLALAYEKKGMRREAADTYTRFLSLGHKGPKADQSKEKIKSLNAQQKQRP
jgi:tetratricopeptide (TPR) repeat protein